MNTSKIDAVMKDLRDELAVLDIELDVKSSIKGNITYCATSFNVKVHIDEAKSTTTGRLIQVPAPSKKTVVALADFTSIERSYYDYIQASKLKSDLCTQIINAAGSIIKFDNQDMIVIGISSKRADAGVIVRHAVKGGYYKISTHAFLSSLSK